MCEQETHYEIQYRKLPGGDWTTSPARTNIPTKKEAEHILKVHASPVENYDPRRYFEYRCIEVTTIRTVCPWSVEVSAEEDRPLSSAL